MAFGGAKAGMPDFSRFYDVSDQLQGMTTDPTATEKAGLSEFSKATNLEDLKKAYGNYFNSIAAPAIGNQAITAGQGRSGAATEATALGGASIGKDLAALQNQRQAEYGQLMAGTGRAAAERQLQALISAMTGEREAATAAGGMENQFNISKMTAGGSYLSNFINALLRSLGPMETGRTSHEKDTGWNVNKNIKTTYGVGG